MESMALVASSPYLMGEASFKFKDNTKNAALKGIIPSQEDAVAHTKKDIVKGNYDELTYSDRSIIIGDTFAEDIGAGHWRQCGGIIPQCKSGFIEGHSNL